MLSVLKLAVAYEYDEDQGVGRLRTELVRRQAT